MLFEYKSGGILKKEGEMENIAGSLDVIKSAGQRIDYAFKLLGIFEIKVPAFTFNVQLEAFRERNRDSFFYFHGEINDASFRNVTDKLVPGRTYVFNLFGIGPRKIVSFLDCLKFMRSRQALLVGAQGLSVAWDLGRDNFPKGKWIVSLDEEKGLYRHPDGKRGVPGIYHCSYNRWHFSLYGDSGSNCDSGDCLLCVCDASS